jgi:hypothetical protein
MAAIALSGLEKISATCDDRNKAKLEDLRKRAGALPE